MPAAAEYPLMTGIVGLPATQPPPIPQVDMTGVQPMYVGIPQPHGDAIGQFGTIASDARYGQPTGIASPVQPYDDAAGRAAYQQVMGVPQGAPSKPSPYIAALLKGIGKGKASKEPTERDRQLAEAQAGMEKQLGGGYTDAIAGGLDAATAHLRGGE